MKIAKPRILVLTGWGINCDYETQFAFSFEKAGGIPERVNIGDLVRAKRKLNDYQVLAIPGGFSYGDDTGAGNALAWRIRNNLWDEVLNFVNRDTLTIGICNGFQVLANLGFVPAFNGKYGERQVALVHNDFPRYNCRWVDLQFFGSSPWVKGLERMSVPIAHGEGKFYTKPDILKKLNEKGMIAVRYVNGEISQAQNLPYNPNGSLEDVAGITDESGRVLGLMPHSERNTEFTHHPLWTLRKEIYKRQGREIPKEGPGLQIFRNAVNYFG